MIENKMLNNEAWLGLGNAARVAFIYFKNKSFPPNPEGFELTYKDMKPVMSREAFSKAIKELETGGFIERMQRGGLYNQKSLYRMANQWQKSSSETEPIQVRKPNLLG
jgi:hypothetical protein